MWSFCSTKSFLVSKHLSTYQKHFIMISFGNRSFRECISARDTFREGDSAFLETLPSLPTLNMALFSFHIRSQPRRSKGSYHLSEDSVELKSLGLGPLLASSQVKFWFLSETFRQYLQNWGHALFAFSFFWQGLTKTYDGLFCGADRCSKFRK